MFTFNLSSTFVKQVETKLDRDIEKAVDRVVEDAKQNAPVKTGKLKDSIQRNGLSIEVVDYGIYVEYGTSDMPAQPYIRPALGKFQKFLKED